MFARRVGGWGGIRLSDLVEEHDCRPRRYFVPDLTRSLARRANDLQPRRKALAATSACYHRLGVILPSEEETQQPAQQHLQNSSYTNESVLPVAAVA